VHMPHPVLPGRLQPGQQRPAPIIQGTGQVKHKDQGTLLQVAEVHPHPITGEGLPGVLLHP